MREEYQPVIGLEIHVELGTKSKMFCSCPNNSQEKQPNLNICPICLGHPGTLPVINREAVKKVIKTGIALGSHIPEYSRFDRKNYFYPDLPKGYQISQYEAPLCQGGYLIVEERKIQITRIHLEEDTGRLIHPQGTDYSLIDFNRAGIPLMELVTEPEITSAQEARKFAEELRLILRYLNVSLADMEKGQMRCEVNLSLHKENEELGTKVEIKNLNSFWAIEKGIEYEIERQKKLLRLGKKVIQETRGWDAQKGITVSQRIKEESHDYRYFPEPDLPPLHISKAMVQEIKSDIPELPQEKRNRFKKEYGLDEKIIEIFVQNKELGEYFEKVSSELRNWIKEIEIKPKIERDEFLKLTRICSNYIITDLQGLLQGNSIKKNKISPENFAEFVTLIYKGKISSRIAKHLLFEMFRTGTDPSQIIEKEGLIQITDNKEIEDIINSVMAKNQKAVNDFKSGKENALQFLIGQVMAESKGRANPEKLRKILRNILTEKK